MPDEYRQPPEPILSVMDAPTTPSAMISPARDAMLLIRFERYPSIAAVAAPFHRLAGLRVDPKTNGPHLPPRLVELTIVALPDGKHRPVELPASGRFGPPIFAPTGRQFAMMRAHVDGTELWIGDMDAAALRPLPGIRLNAVHGPVVQWRADGRTLLCLTIPSGRGQPPAAPAVPPGPIVQESFGQAGPVRTFADLLQNPHDEALFDYFATSQLTIVDPETGAATPIGEPAIFAAADPSPDGRFLMVVRIRRPYSYLHPLTSFPQDVEIWDARGRPMTVIARHPLQDQIPIEGVPTGPRNVEWALWSPATLVWVEALDGGDPRRAVPHRDALLTLEDPFTGPAVERLRLEHRFAGLAFDETGRWAILRDYDRDRRWTRTFLLDARDPTLPQLLWDRSIHDRYGDPGAALAHTLPNAQRALVCRDDALFMVGAGATPAGDRPFLDRLQLPTGQTERLFQSGAEEYEAPIGLANAAGSAFLTRHESHDEPPNFRWREISGTGYRALTQFPDPTPLVRGIEKRLVTYRRNDGVPLSFTLYLPPGHRRGERLPTVLWAYPQEFTSADTAGQVAGSPHRFTTLAGPSHLFFLLAGYAVLDGATMPVVGTPETANDTFLEQIVASARAAIETAADMGVTDPDRVGVGGHSYGAFMAANLLAHSRLFRAGIARSGAFNRTLTPFGFQHERRTLWEASDVYARLSPFQFAHQITAPLLLIHGTADNNPGTSPIQSERMYQAVRGNGGRVRLVLLPHESHAYVARESIEHVLCEMIAWFDEFVKGGGSGEAFG